MKDNKEYRKLLNNIYQVIITGYPHKIKTRCG